MKTDPADRYQHPGELLADLINVATDMDLQGVPADGIVWQQVDEPAVRRLSGAMVLFAAVVVFCLTAVTLHLMPGDSDQSRLPAIPVTREGDPTDGNSSPDGQLTNGNQTPESAADSTGSDGTDDPDLVPQPDHRKPFIVHTQDGQQLGYDTLIAAISPDRPSVEIELTFDGVAMIPVHQIPRLEHQTVNMYAARGKRPVLEYQGTPNDADATSMFTLVSSHLYLEGIDLRLVAETEMPDATWTMFDCSGSSLVSLTHCSVDIQAANGTPAEVCRLEESSPDNNTRQNTEISLWDTVVRGQADMFHVAARANARLHLRNCGFGLQGRLLNNTGSDSTDPPGVIDLTLEHVTCVLDAPLIRIFESDFRAKRQSISQVRVNSIASVFCSTTENGVLIDSQGTVMVDDQRDLLTWNGETNLYCGFSRFWKLLNTTSAQDDQQEYDFDSWKEYWTRTRASASETTARLFTWSDAAWETLESEPGEPSVLTGLEPEWLRISPEWFNSQNLPLHHYGQPPGVKVRRLPEFP